jgi:xanthine dehydrogenase iron-sulfur cluster and FAD-binding subunit A
MGEVGEDRIRAAETLRGNFFDLSPLKDSPPQLPPGPGLLEAIFLIRATL